MLPDLFSRDALALAPPRHSLHVAVRFQDVDAAGIVFFARVLDYFHDAYLDRLRATGVRLDEVLRTRAWAAPLVHAEADYLRPLGFGDVVDVAIVRARFEGSRLTVGYRIARGEEVVAVGATVHLFVDAERFARIAPPEAVRAAFEGME